MSDVVFVNISASQGLPHEGVQAIAVDGTGFVWMGTQNGLARWDGYRFKVYQPIAHDEHSLPGNSIYALHVDQTGQLWIGTNSGALARYDSARDQFVRIGVGEKGVSHATVTAIADDGSGGLWVGTRGGLDHFFADGSVQHLHHDANNPYSLAHEVVTSLLRDRQGRVWVGSNTGLQFIEESSKTAKTARQGTVPKLQTQALPISADAAAQVIGLSQSSDGKIWVGTTSLGVFIVQPDNEKKNSVRPLFENAAQRYDLHPNFLMPIVEAKPGEVWIGTSSGILRVNSTTLEMRLLQHEHGQTTSIANNSIRALKRDINGILWVGTERGISHAQPGQTAIVNLFAASHTAQPVVTTATNPATSTASTAMTTTTAQNISRDSNSLTDGDVLAMAQLSDGRIWLGLKKNGVDIINAKASGVQALKVPGQTESLTARVGRVSSFVEQADGTLYLGTMRGLFRSNVAATRLEAIALPPRSDTARIYAMLQIAQNLYVAGEGGLWQVDLQAALPATQSAAALPLRANRLPGTQGLEQEFITVLAQAPDGALWIGTRHNGVYRYDFTRQTLANWSANPQGKHALLHNNIGSILFDRLGRVWVATQGGGISILPDAKHGLALSASQVTHLGTAQGLPNNLVDMLLADQDGNVWASTDAGIVRIDPRSLNMQVFGRADGAGYMTYWVNSGLRTQTGELIFGGSQGVTVIWPQLLKSWDFQPPVVVTDLQIGGKPFPANQFNRARIALADEKNLPPLQITPQGNSIAVEFAALDYSTPQQNRYAYWLEGYDKDWMNSEPARRLAAYTNLPPGRYTLHLRGSNRNGMWAEQELALPLEVLPAWYQTWWWRILEACGALALVYAVVQGRTRYLRARQHELEWQVQQRTDQLQQKQAELIYANTELNHSNTALNSANAELASSVDTLRMLGDIGRDITANLDTEQVFLSLYQHMDGLVGAPTMVIYRMAADGHSLTLAFGRENGVALATRHISLDSPTSQAALAARSQQELSVNVAAGEMPASHIAGTQVNCSALFTPMIVDGQVLGVLSVQALQEQAYGERERLIFRTLSAYGAIALANAEAHTALHHAQEQLVQQEKMASLGALVGGVAHEINTPLGTAMMAMSGASAMWDKLHHVLASGAISKAQMEANVEEGREYSEMALRSATRAAELIDSFKMIATRFDSDQQETLGLEKYLHDVAMLVRNPLQQAGHQLLIDVPADLQVVVVEAALTEALSRIVANVVDHAFGPDYDGTAGILTIRAERYGKDEIKISVSDTGLGIAAENLGKVFDPFFTTQSGVGGHVGLGLHVAYNHVVQRLQGRISIKSKIGCGTEVILILKSQGNVGKNALTELSK